jgi:YkoY family integral membrane protein
MFGQTFTPGDLPVIAFLILLEGLLSADNALVLALMVRHLPPARQRKALLYGLGGAFVFRLIAILVATWIINLWWLQAIGALYLLFLPVKHWFEVRKKKSLPDGAAPVGAGFWQTVALVELTDIAFAIDSVVAAVALMPKPEKVWVVYLGAIMGVVLLRFAAGLFIGLLHKFPALEHMAYALVAWVGVKLAFMAGHNFQKSWEKTNGRKLGIEIHEMSPVFFWSVMGAMILAFVVYSWATRDLEQAPAAEPPE